MVFLQTKDIIMKIKVVVDTNAINNSGLSNKLFGNRKELEAIIKKIDLFIPETVIKEIKERKRKEFYKKKSELIKNDLFKMVGGDITTVNSLDATTIIENDCNLEDIPYFTLKIDSVEDFFDKFERRLFRNEPPFETSSDKGIKDAFIAYSVDKLLESIDTQERIILVTSDSRLKEYYENNNRVRVADKISGVLKLIEHDTGLPVKTNNRIDIEFAGVREKTNLEKKIEKMLTDLRNSITFQKTHLFIGILDKNKALLTKENKADIIRSTLNNNQIKWIATDQDIYSFLLPIYYDCLDLLTEQEQFEFEILMGINHNFCFSG